MVSPFRCVVHGSFSKHFSEIKEAIEVFTSAGIEVLAPKNLEITEYLDGFGLFEDEKNLDPRFIELKYLYNLKNLGKNGFSYFVNPGGYIGRSASYELGIAQLTNVRCFLSHKLRDHPAYVHGKSIWSPKSLTNYITAFDSLPLPSIKRSEKDIHALWEDLMVPGSIVATGAIIEHQPKTTRREKEILLVKTYKWGNRYSIVGGKVKRNERLGSALLREVKEETNLSGQTGAHICTFDQIDDPGYYKIGLQHIFVDNVVTVQSKNVSLNEEAESFIWIKPDDALQYLDIEPNARKTIELYSQKIASAA